MIIMCPQSLPTSIYLRYFMFIKRIKQISAKDINMSLNFNKKILKILFEIPDKELSLLCDSRIKELKNKLDNEGLNKLFSCKGVKPAFLFSDFLYKTLLTDPGLLPKLLDVLYVKEPSSYYSYNMHLNAIIQRVLDEKIFLAEIRKLRNREMAKICLRDICILTADFFEISTALSNLASSLIIACIKWIKRDLSKRFGLPRKKDGSPLELITVCMGKLGGNELNFSSDVDLIFLFSEPGFTDGKNRISAQEFFTILVRRLINFLSTRTEQGFCLRVDTRLRPFGDSGPLVMDLGALEDYFLIHGRDWERFAWIKARAITGIDKDIDALYSIVTPFIYRRYLDFGVFSSLREMKDMIFQQVKKKGLDNNVKLGPGGIRQIEFIVQAIQLVRGGKDKEIRTKNLLKTLEVLKDKKYLPLSAINELSDSYIFLRILENRLQERSDQQTHILPQDFKQFKLLAYSLGYKNQESFKKDIDLYRGFVQKHFSNLLEQPNRNIHIIKDLDKIKDIWEDNLPLDSSISLLASLGFKDPKRVLDLITAHKTSRATIGLGSIGQKRLKELMPVLLKEVLRYKESELMLLRVLSVIESIQKRTSYLVLLRENPSALKYFVKFVGISPWISEQIKRLPILIDELIDTRSLYKTETIKELRQTLNIRLNSIDKEDIESLMDELRIFKHSHTLRIAISYLSGISCALDTSLALSNLAQVIIEKVFELCFYYMVARHGWPIWGLRQSTNKKYYKKIGGFSVIGYGKLGGKELSFASDLDLVFLHTGVDKGYTTGKYPIDLATYFPRLGQRIIQMLNLNTAFGRLYEVDMRLRPSGEAGVLVSKAKAFRKYQLFNAWTWEHQALFRARPICGDDEIRRFFIRTRWLVLRLPRDIECTKKEILDMKARLKQAHLKEKDHFHIKYSDGGLLDIEFFAQFIALCFSYKCSDLIKSTSTVDILRNSVAIGFKYKDIEVLVTAYKKLIDLYHKQSLLGLSPLISSAPNISEKVIDILKRYNFY